MKTKKKRYQRLDKKLFLRLLKRMGACSEARAFVSKQSTPGAAWRKAPLHNGWHSWLLRLIYSHDYEFNLTEQQKSLVTCTRPTCICRHETYATASSIRAALNQLWPKVEQACLQIAIEQLTHKKEL